MPPIGTKDTVRIEGLSRLERALGRLQAEAKKRLNVRLLAIGKIVEGNAHSLIRSKGLVGGPRSSGQLDKLTRTSVSATGTVFVRAGAVRRKGRDAPFNYPRLWEFARSGQRAFLLPALERSRGAVDAAVGSLFHDFEHIFGD